MCLELLATAASKTMRTHRLLLENTLRIVTVLCLILNEVRCNGNRSNNNSRCAHSELLSPASVTLFIWRVFPNENKPFVLLMCGSHLTIATELSL